MAKPGDDQTAKTAALAGDKPGTEAKPAPVDAAPAKPVAQAESTNGPDNDYGVEKPGPNADSVAWIDYDSKVFSAKEAYDKEHPPTDAKAKKPKGDDKPEPPAKGKDAKAATDAEPKAGEGDEEPKPPGAVVETKTDAPVVAKLDPNDKFEIEPGNSWTRASIVAEIQNTRVQRDMARGELAELSKTTGLKTVKDFTAVWGPWLKEMVDNPKLQPYLEAARETYYRRQADPEFDRFMRESEDNYEAWLGTDEGKAHAAKIDWKPGKKVEAKDDDSALAREVAGIRDSLAERDRVALEQQQFTQWAGTIKAEREKLWADYSWIQAPHRWNQIVDRAVNVSNIQKQEVADGKREKVDYTLTDAVKDMWPQIIEWWQFDKLNAKPAAGKDTPVPVRSGGGSGTVRTEGDEGDDQAEVSYAGKGGKDAAVAAWLKAHPNGLE